AEDARARVRAAARRDRRQAPHRDVARSHRDRGHASFLDGGDTFDDGAGAVNTFAVILQRVVESVPGAIGAIFADWEGEPIGEFAIELPKLEVQIMGAQWGLVWAELQRSLGRARLGRAEELLIGGDLGSVLVRQVTDEYYVVPALGNDAHLAKAMTEL